MSNKPSNPYDLNKVLNDEQQVLEFCKSEFSADLTLVEDLLALVAETFAGLPEEPEDAIRESYYVMFARAANSLNALRTLVLRGHTSQCDPLLRYVYETIELAHYFILNHNGHAFWRQGAWKPKWADIIELVDTQQDSYQEWDILCRASHPNWNDLIDKLREVGENGLGVATSDEALSMNVRCIMSLCASLIYHMLRAFKDTLAPKTYAKLETNFGKLYRKVEKLQSS